MIIPYKANISVQQTPISNYLIMIAIVATFCFAEVFHRGNLCALCIDRLVTFRADWPHVATQWIFAYYC